MSVFVYQQREKLLSNVGTQGLFLRDIESSGTQLSYHDLVSYHLLAELLPICRHAPSQKKMESNTICLCTLSLQVDVPGRHMRPGTAAWLTHRRYLSRHLKS